MVFMKENRRYLLIIVMLMILLLYSTVIHSLWVIILAVLNCCAALLTEYLFMLKRKRTRQLSYDTLITAMLFTLVLPPFTPLEVSLIGIVFGIFFGKCVYGGSGYTIFNPALVGRVFLHASFTKPMTTIWLDQYIGGVGISDIPMDKTIAVLIILMGLLLLSKKVISIYISGSILVTYGLLTVGGYMLTLGNQMSPADSLLSGGVLLGALFMAVDPVTSPKNQSAQILYGLIIGSLVYIIRSFSTTQGAIVFAILIGNMLTPIIDISVDTLAKSQAQKRGESLE